jgi:hypothetical protein
MTENATMTQQDTTPPTHKQIDALILEYAAASADFQSSGNVKRLAGESAAELGVRLAAWDDANDSTQAAAQLVVLDVKARLVAMVAAHGARHAEKSMRLSGDHNQATVTRGTQAEIQPDGVAELKAYLDKIKIPDITKMFFTERISYSLVAGPAEVLKTLTLGSRTRIKMTALVASCFKIKSNAPALKIEAIAAAKPTQAA